MHLENAASFKLVENRLEATMTDIASGRIEREEDTVSSILGYKDYAKAPVPPGAGEIKFRGGITTHFPALLHAMLTRAEVDGYASICSWETHGRSFVVHDRDRFVSEVMPLYFRQTQYASFQRQLNLYGFQRLLSQETYDCAGAYFHAMFLRTRQDLCPAIQRATEKELRDMKKSTKSSQATLEPDFTRCKAMPLCTEEHIKLAKNITIPQRKLPTTKTEEKPQIIIQKSQSKAPAAPQGTDLIISISNSSQDQQVNDTYASLFLNDGSNQQDELDLSWMEPRPIAPDLVPLLQNSRNVLRDPPNDDTVCGKFTQEKLLPDDQGSFTPQNVNRPATVKRGLPNDDTHDQDPMGAFLSEMGIEMPDSHELPPPHKMMNTTTNDNAACFGHAPMHQGNTGYAAAYEPCAAQQVPNAVSPRQVRRVTLPCTFPEVSDFPQDLPLMITSVDSPYVVIYANRALEALWGVKREEIVDKPLQEFCPPSEHAKLNTIAFTVLLLRQQQELDVSFQVNRTMTLRTQVAPFYMADDLNQINDVQYLVWNNAEY